MVNFLLNDVLQSLAQNQRKRKRRTQTMIARYLFAKAR